MNILVTDGENRSSLAVTRSLGKKGCVVIVSGRDVENISACSRFCHKAYKTPDPLIDGNNYLQAIAEIVRKEHIDVIFPMTEQTVYCLNKSRNLLGNNVILASASPEKMESVSNKYTLFQLAEKLGVDIPETEYVADIDQFYKLRDKITEFPVVVKPAFSKIQDGEKILSTGVMYAASPEELNYLYDTKPALRYPSMIQEMITGEGTGLFTLYDTDRHLALFSHRRILEKPPSGGVSVLSESVALDDNMVEAAHRLLSAIQWTGIAMVEFKRDERDGKAKLMEINGRFWGSLQLAISSGIDFPSLCLNYYLDQKPTLILSDYKVRHKLKWVFGILDHLLIRLKKGDRFINIPPETPSRCRVALELISLNAANTSYDVYEAGDVQPTIMETKMYIQNIIRLKR